MDVEAKNNSGGVKDNPTRRKRRNICIGAVVSIIGTIILILILALTVFKAKKAVITVASVTLDDLSVSLDTTRLRVNLNLTVDVNLFVNNPNKVGFKYKNSSALLNYRGEQVGQVPIPAGRISADKTVGMNVTLILMGDRFLSNSQFYSDVLGGALPLNIYTKLSGKVSILKIFKIHVRTSSSCDLTVFISNRTVSTDKHCRYKASF